MPNELILVDRVGKKFHRTLTSAFLQGMGSLARKTLRLRPRKTLGKDEFWALRGISFVVRRGECLGVIGPNGAGKSTLLKLIHREYPPDEGKILALGPVKSLIRIGSGLQPLLSGRENIYIQCHQMGLGKSATDAKLDEIVAFAGLEEAVDAPVKTYSDGMYARLEFSIATSVQGDILLVDEVLAVGDIAFQIRALDRLNQLKRGGAAIVFVSHSEMNVRHVADRCLLLFNGCQVALGEPDALFYQYYQSIGYLNRRLQPLGAAMPKPPDMFGALTVKSLRWVARGQGESGQNGVLAFNQPYRGGEDGPSVKTGDSLDLSLEYATESEVWPAYLTLHFWNAAEVLAASVDSTLANKAFRLHAGSGEIRLRIPFVSLTPGYYRLAAGFTVDGKCRAYAGCLLELHVVTNEMVVYRGLSVMQAVFGPVNG